LLVRSKGKKRDGLSLHDGTGSGQVDGLFTRDRGNNGKDWEGEEDGLIKGRELESIEGWL